MKKIIIFLAIIAMTVNINAIPTDEYGRNIYGHDRDGGHTVSRHVGKSHTYLRSRCRNRKSSRFYTSYRSIRSVDYTLKNMIYTKANRARINLFNNMRGRDVPRRLPVTTQILYDKYHLITGFGKGIDCRKLGEVRRERHWWGSYTRRLDEYNYLKKATAQLGYNYSKHRWYIQTSFPVR